MNTCETCFYWGHRADATHGVCHWIRADRDVIIKENHLALVTSAVSGGTTPYLSTRADFGCVEWWNGITYNILATRNLESES